MAAALERYLLAEHRPDGELIAVDVAGDAPARRDCDQRREQRVVAEVGADGERVGIKVEQRARALNRGPEVAQILEPVAGEDAVARSE